MVLLVSLIFFLALPAAIAFATSIALEKLALRWSPRLRITVSALTAGMMIIAVPMAAAMSDAFGSGGPVLAPLVSIAFFGGLIALLVGFPVAWLRHRSAAERAGSTAPEAFD
jgi:hypothetical protein